MSMTAQPDKFKASLGRMEGKIIAMALQREMRYYFDGDRGEGRR